jgi:hypothetical protein
MTLQELLVNYVWDDNVEIQFREHGLSVDNKAVYTGSPRYLPLELNPREVLGIYSNDDHLVICVKATREEISK